MPIKGDYTEHEGLQPVIQITGDTFREIYETYFPQLVNYAYRFLKDEDRARLAVDNMYLSIWEQRERLSFKGQGFLKGFLYAATRNKAVDLVRESQQEVKVLRDFRYLADTTDYHDERDKAIILAEAVEYLRKAIRELSPQYRAVMEMILDGKDHVEISNELQISQETVRTNKKRAIAALQKRSSTFVLVSLAILVLDLHH